jgi:hypothetical protein
MQQGVVVGYLVTLVRKHTAFKLFDRKFLQERG